ncbi:MAG: TonB-dependent receptor [Bacteroidetes bacterium]|nr:TonB-dependent receptor [Bacteroidota bacterium]
MKSIIIFIQTVILTIFSSVGSPAQNISGKVSEMKEDGETTQLFGVNVYWENTTIGTSTGSDGRFKLSLPNEMNNRLIFSYIGYKTDTLTVSESEKYIEHTMHSVQQLDEIVISERQAGTYISRMEPIATQQITGAELCKAACCNLSESFETNATVDVTYSDAVTGAKQIQMLGLSGTYVQLMTENFPSIRGIATAYGLTYIPGRWMESIQVSKGAGSVINGYESVTGQINIEFKKPAKSEKVFANLYGSSEGGAESSTNASVMLNDRLSTMMMVQVQNMFRMNDSNDDGFIDHPMVRQYNIFNRWDYLGKNITVRFGARYLEEQRLGGQSDYWTGDAEDRNDAYGIKMNTGRYEGFLKTGMTFPGKPGTSIAMINTFSSHELQAGFGYHSYYALQNSLYSNLIFQTNIKTDRHKISTGLDMKYDSFDEILNDSILDHTDAVPGGHFQYTLHIGSTFTLLTGIRADHHSRYGWFASPRLHLKYDLTKNTTLRASGGKGYRSANVLAENVFFLASSRKIRFVENPDMEEAWNYGINVTRNFHPWNRELTVNAEFYRTDFINQVIMDLDSDVHEVSFYNLNGKSFSNSTQIETRWQVIRGLDAVAAFRYTDVRMTISDELREKPLISRYKGLLNLSYSTKLKKWQFDYTMQMNGPGRIPSTAGNPEPYMLEESFPLYSIMNAQVTKYFRTWSLYAGVENLTNFTQKNPVIAGDEPFGEYFDSSLIWGPIYGRKFYFGLRWAIERD